MLTRISRNVKIEYDITDTVVFDDFSRIKITVTADKSTAPPVSYMVIKGAKGVDLFEKRAMKYWFEIRSLKKDVCGNVY